MTQDTVTKPKGLIRSEYFRSESGRTYWCDRDGKAQPISEADYLDAMVVIPDEDGDRAYSEMLERRAENDTWFGRDDGVEGW